MMIHIGDAKCFLGEEAMLNKLAVRITEKATSMALLGSEEFDIYVYAFEKLISQLVVYSLLLLIGFIMNSPISMIIYHVFLALLRGQTSGYHAKSPLGCLLLSCLVSVIIIYISNRVNELFMIPALIISIIYILYAAPINHKDLNLSPYEIERLRNSTKYILTGEMNLIIILYLFHFTHALYIPASLAIISVALSMLLSKILKQEVNKDVRTD